MKRSEMTPLMLPERIWNEIADFARNERPYECCGLLLGQMDQASKTVTRFWPLVNELRSETAYRSEPRSLFEAYRSMRSTGDEIVAVFHSHPSSEAVPSRRDRDEITYPEALTVIAGFPRTHEPLQIRAWQFVNGNFEEVGIELK